MSTILMNIMSEPRSVKHIGYVVKESPLPRHLRLIEIVEAQYPHPGAPDDANVQMIQERLIGDYLESSVVGSNLLLLRAAQKATRGAHLSSAQ
jgi:hypothetical protein